MATPIQLLQLSPTMSEGTIVRWHVKEGDSVSAGDVLAEVETDKAVMEQEAFDDGTILKILVPQGQAVAVGGNIAIVGEQGEDVSGLENDGGQAAPAAEKKSEEKKPEKKEEKAAKPSAEKPQEKPKAAPVEAKAKAKAAAPAAPARAEGERVVASPLARKMAEEHGLELAEVEGTGPNGRITKRDIERAVEEGGKKAERPAAPKAPRPAAAAPAASDEEVPLSGMRKTIARRLVQSRQEVPSFSMSVEVDAQPVVDAVARLREKFPDDKLTVTHFVIKAMASMLMKHEWLRTQWIDGKLVRKAGAHVSVAVAIEDGLLTPVIRDAQTKGLLALADELRELAARARDRKLTEEDLSGGVQTLSNLGMFDIDHFDAIINPPESSILAVGRIADKPVVVDGELQVGKRMTITLSCDHRVVDGAVGAAYLRDVKAALEDPLLILA